MLLTFDVERHVASRSLQDLPQAVDLFLLIDYQHRRLDHLARLDRLCVLPHIKIQDLLSGYVASLLLPLPSIFTLTYSLNVILFALDQFIITVSVPQIVDEFQSLSQIEWLNTAFFIPCAGGILIYSQIMTVFSPRWVYLSAVVVFEVGSAVCGAARSMEMLIVGRAIAGLGGAGMWK